MRIDATHVDRVRRFRKRTVEQIEIVSIEEVRGLSTLELRMIEVLRPTEQFVKLNRARGPTRNVLRQLLQQRQGSFTTSIADRSEERRVGKECRSWRSTEAYRE